MGAGRHFFDSSTTFTAYMGAASYPVYIIHQAILVAIAYYVLMLAIPPALQFLAIVIFSILLTFACYEILRRIPGYGHYSGLCKKLSGPFFLKSVKSCTRCRVEGKKPDRKKSGKIYVRFSA